jgi:hypothetical protein
VSEQKPGCTDNFNSKKGLNIDFEAFFALAQSVKNTGRNQLKIKRYELR